MILLSWSDTFEWSGNDANGSLSCFCTSFKVPKYRFSIIRGIRYLVFSPCISSFKKIKLSRVQPFLQNLHNWEDSENLKYFNSICSCFHDHDHSIYYSFHRISCSKIYLGLNTTFIINISNLLYLKVRIIRSRMRSRNHRDDTTERNHDKHINQCVEPDTCIVFLELS